MRLAGQQPPSRENRILEEDLCSGSEAGSYLRLIDFVYHSTLGLRVIKKKETYLDATWYKTCIRWLLKPHLKKQL